MENNELTLLEKLEYKYLIKYYHFLKFTQDEILKGLDTKNAIKDDWFHKWKYH